MGGSLHGRAGCPASAASAGSREFWRHVQDDGVQDVGA